jgi:hypothetical protein
VRLTGFEIQTETLPIGEAIVAPSVVGAGSGPAWPAPKDLPMHILRSAACVIAGAALVSACSKSAASSGPAPADGTTGAAAAVASRDPCSVMTKADAESAVGAALPQNSGNQALGTCGYTSADFSEGAQLTLGDWESIKKAATGGAHQPSAIGGVGDEALYFTGRETGAGPLYVRHGQQGFLLVLNGSKIDHMTGAAAMATEQALAAKILARL